MIFWSLWEINRDHTKSSAALEPSKFVFLEERDRERLARRDKITDEDTMFEFLCALTLAKGGTVDVHHSEAKREVDRRG